jgi:hypothetical protein
MQENPSICTCHVRLSGQLLGSAAHTESPEYISRPFIQAADPLYCPLNAGCCQLVSYRYLPLLKELPVEWELVNILKAVGSGV